MWKESGETCPGCYGKKVQTNKDGMRVICPVCHGTGRFISPRQPGKVVL